MTPNAPAGHQAEYRGGVGWHKSRILKITVCKVSFLRNNDQVAIHKSEAGKLLHQAFLGYNASRCVLTVFFRKELPSCHHYLHYPLSMELK
jgi:hypothetical protein